MGCGSFVLDQAEPMANLVSEYVVVLQVLCEGCVVGSDGSGIV